MILFLRLALSDKITIINGTARGAIHKLEFDGVNANLYTNDDMKTVDLNNLIISTLTSVELKCKSFKGSFVNLEFPENNSQLTFTGSWDQTTAPIFNFHHKFNASFVNFPEYAGFMLYEPAHVRFHSSQAEILIQGVVQLHNVLSVYSEDQRLVVFYHLQMMENSHVNAYFIENGALVPTYSQVGVCETAPNSKIDLSNLLISLSTYIGLGANVTCGNCTIESQCHLVIYYNFQQKPYFYTDYSLPRSITFMYRNTTDVDLVISDHINESVPLYCAKEFRCDYYQEYNAIKINSQIYNEFMNPDLVNPICINQGDLKCAGIVIPKEFNLTKYIPRTPIPADSNVTYDLSGGEIAGVTVSVILAAICIAAGALIYAKMTFSNDEEYLPQV